MKIYKETIHLKSHGGTPTFFDITKNVKDIIQKSQIQNGVMHVISPHTTCSVFFEEYDHDETASGDRFLNLDLNDVLTTLFPDNTHEGQYRYPGNKHYEAVLAWDNAEDYIPGGDRTALLNADAHLKATLLGSSETFEIDQGKLAVGTTGYIYFVDFDRTRERDRKCRVVIMGE